MVGFISIQISIIIFARYNRILSLDEEIRNNPGAQANNFNPEDSASLPIGIVKEIGNTIYIICIDSARFTPQGAFFSVYMAMDFPDHTLVCYHKSCLFLKL